jgi:hypothetical protein
MVSKNKVEREERRKDALMPKVLESNYAHCKNNLLFPLLTSLINIYFVFSLVNILFTWAEGRAKRRERGKEGKRGIEGCVHLLV